MNSLFSKMKSAAQKRAAFNRTVYEIERMPLDIALDLNIHRPDARAIAYKAVYGS